MNSHPFFMKDKTRLTDLLMHFLLLMLWASRTRLRPGLSPALPEARKRREATKKIPETIPPQKIKCVQLGHDSAEKLTNRASE